MTWARVRAALAALAAGSVLCAVAPELTPADQLFDAAREARTHSSYGHYATYATVLRFRHGDHAVTSSWETIEDVHRRMVHSHALRREEAANPHVPHGINVGILGFVINKERNEDPIGQLTLAVDQDFGLAIDATSITASRDMSEVSSAAIVLRRIGRTGTVVRTYEVTDLGDVVEAGAALHHLGLRPLRDPKKFRLRELWSDAKTSAPVRAVVAGVGNRGPLDNVDWRVDFAQIDGGTYVARETALAPLQSSNGRLDDATITFEGVELTNQLKPYELIGFSGDVGTTDP
ncbi:MAG TPA: hypothetical protein VHT53_05560 [Candidatus Elarobacter sp.]|jgi:hypothetical protein|nr:hypothetical protein [Candidatus Elarobacter sp.]